MAVTLTKYRYESAPGGQLLSWGIIENSEDGVFMERDGPSHLIWGAWKGYGDDWAIYVSKFSFGDAVSPWMLDNLHDHGHKPFDRKNLEKMIDADTEVWERLRS